MPHSRFDPPCGLGVSRTSELTAWLGRAQPGDRVVYHQGSLAFDRSSTSSLQRRERRRIDELATAAHAAAAAGRVHLVQERLAAGTFRYLAVRALQQSGPLKLLITDLVPERTAIEGAAVIVAPKLGEFACPSRETTP